MGRVGFTALRKLVATLVVAILLLVLYRLWPDGPFSGFAIGGFGLVAGPILILVLIDTGRTLRRTHLGRVATLISWLPQLLLGAVACIAGLGGLGLVALNQFTSPSWRLWAGVASFGALLFGIDLLRRAEALDERNRG
jgi:hypothetical protein